MHDFKFEKNFFSANTAFICTIAAKHVLDRTLKIRYRALGEAMITEILGQGSSMGYMVGFGNHYPRSIHDRDRYFCNNGDISILNFV